MKLDTVVQDLQHYERDSRWLHTRFDRLRRKYPDRFVAVYGCKVIAHAQSIPELTVRIKKSNPDAVGKAAIEFLPKDDLQLIL